jgi:hypothetical protein
MYVLDKIFMSCVPAGAGGAGPYAALGAAPPRPGRCPGGGPADCRESAGVYRPGRTVQAAQGAVVPGRPARGQVPAGSSQASSGRDSTGQASSLTAVRVMQDRAVLRHDDHIPHRQETSNMHGKQLRPKTHAGPGRRPRVLGQEHDQ